MIDPEKLEEIKKQRNKEKLEVKHSGPCSSPYYNNCPCQWECPLHGRCCDCVHFHIEKRKQEGGPASDTNWLVACMKLAHEGKMDEVYVHKNESAG